MSKASNMVEPKVYPMLQGCKRKSERKSRQDLWVWACAGVGYDTHLSLLHPNDEPISARLNEGKGACWSNARVPVTLRAAPNVSPSPDKENMGVLGSKKIQTLEKQELARLLQCILGMVVHATCLVLWLDYISQGALGGQVSGASSCSPGQRAAWKMETSCGVSAAWEKQSLQPPNLSSSEEEELLFNSEPFVTPGAGWKWLIFLLKNKIRGAAGAATLGSSWKTGI